ncbi:MAG TPA: hypothetical protein VGE20_18655 [Ramlibacter sp.]
MSTFGRGRERPVASIEDLIAAVRRESAAALSTAEAFFPDALSRQSLAVPRRFPGPDGLPGQPERSSRDADTGPRESGGPA